MKRKNIMATIAAFLMAILIAPVTVNAAGVDSTRTDEQNELWHIKERLAELDPWGLDVFDSEAERQECYSLRARGMELLNKYCFVWMNGHEIIMTVQEYSDYASGNPAKQISALKSALIANGLLADETEEETPEEPEKKIISPADVFQFAATTLQEVYEKANAVAPNGSTVDIEDVKNFVIDRINYGGCDNWKETSWIAYIESWKPVYTLEDGTKTDFDGALANAERIEEEKRQETGLPYPDLPVIPGINEPENKEDAPADAADKDVADNAADKNQGTADKAPATPVAPVVPETPAQPDAGKNDAANDQAAADAAAKAEAERKAAEEAAKKAAAEAAAKAEAERKAAEEAAKRAEEEAKKAAEEAAKNPGLDEETMQSLALECAKARAHTLDTYGSLKPVVTGSNGNYDVAFYDGSVMYVGYHITVSSDGTATCTGFFH